MIERSLGSNQNCAEGDINPAVVECRVHRAVATPVDGLASERTGEVRRRLATLDPAP